jgi:hypothetical protein
VKGGGILMTPRDVPGQLYPALGAVLVILIALAVFLLAGWSVSGWALGAVLWAGVFVLGQLLLRVRSRMGNLASSGVLGFELMFKALAILAVLVAVAATHSELVVPAILVFAVAYTIERGLSLATYFGSSAR